MSECNFLLSNISTKLYAYLFNVPLSTRSIGCTLLVRTLYLVWRLSVSSSLSTLSSRLNLSRMVPAPSCRSTRLESDLRTGRSPASCSGANIRPGSATTADRQQLALLQIHGKNGPKMLKMLTQATNNRRERKLISAHFASTFIFCPVVDHFILFHPDCKDDVMSEVKTARDKEHFKSCQWIRPKSHLSYCHSGERQ